LISIGGSLASTVGAENPFRYRGYYYDTETGLYYLQSRYYDSEIGRFISKDGESYHTGQIGAAANLYAYADNNPVMYIDPSGHKIRWKYILNGLCYLVKVVRDVFAFHASSKGIYYGAKYLAKYTAAAFRNMFAMQLDAVLITPASAAQNYPVVVGLLAGLITLVTQIYYFRYQIWDDLKDCYKSFKHAIFG